MFRVQGGNAFDCLTWKVVCGTIDDSQEPEYHYFISLDDETQYICQDEFNECFFASLPAHEACWIDGLTKWKLFVKFPFLFTSSLLRYCSLNHIKQPSLWMQRFLRRDNKERKPTTDFNLFMKVGFAHLFPLFIGVANDRIYSRADESRIPVWRLFAYLRLALISHFPGQFYLELEHGH